MKAVGIFADVFRHAVAPAGDDDCCWFVGWGGLALLVAVAKVYTIRYRGEAREWNGLWSHCGSVDCGVIGPLRKGLDSLDLALIFKVQQAEVFCWLCLVICLPS